MLARRGFLHLLGLSAALPAMARAAVQAPPSADAAPVLISTWGFGQADNLHVAQSQYHDIGVSKRLGIATCWIERRHGLKDSGGTIESEHTVPDYHFRSLAELADAVDAGR